MQDVSDRKTSSVETSVREFYDTYGWVEVDGASGEDRSFRVFRPAYESYHRAVERRTQAVFQPFGDSLLIAGCGDMPDSHVRLARNYPEIACADISARALDRAREKLGPPAELLEASILELPVAENRFDAVFCAHVIYHIDIDLQEKAIAELIRVTKPGGRVVVIASNPQSPFRYVAAVALRLQKMVGGSASSKNPSPEAASDKPALYFARHPLKWWRRFEDRCDVEMQPWDAIGSLEEQAMLPGDRLASGFYRFAAWFERTAPGLAARFWQYPIVILTKR
ncbi:MAG: class I SAM-dependent methyltransferase [Pseudomonadota bacterium]